MLFPENEVLHVCDMKNQLLCAIYNKMTYVLENGLCYVKPSRDLLSSQNTTYMYNLSNSIPRTAIQIVEKVDSSSIKCVVNNIVRVRNVMQRNPLCDRNGGAFGVPIICS